MRRSIIPAEPKPEQVTIITDSREQLPYDFSPMRQVIGTLATGDYSVRGLENEVAYERKSLEDFLGCVGRERERFEREIQRLLAYPSRGIVIESSWGALEIGQWRSQVTPAQAIGSIVSWVSRGVPVVLAHDRTRGQDLMRRLLFSAARRRWREARQLLASSEEFSGEVSNAGD